MVNVEKVERVERLVIAIACVLLSLYITWCLWEAWWMAGVIPEPIGISYPTFIEGESDLREGCGVAIFRLDRASADAITKQGLRYFDNARYSRKSHDHYHTFEPWRPTPHAPDLNDDQSLLSLGLYCAHADMALSEELEQAVREPGNFYTNGPEKVLVIFPKKRLIVLAYFG
ncbi:MULTISPECIES: hypothetical protein [Lysobacter]|uniref:hypothetical protein n=1 Tax=Lysobacter TaxID=68 RepID=UPI001F21BD3E|nr:MULTISPECIES: hypothetical protein [Lysobacter]UJB17331.1 hypothetical protein L1A79_13120 [Lysobacter capsici]UJQ28946.1 hypothetical protein L2D09_01745 [Lysobacter gummosus]